MERIGDKVKVFDFDNTIYDGECCIDFFLFVFKKKKTFSKYLPLAGYTLLLYKLNKLPISKVEEVADSLSHVLIKYKDEASDLIQDFWAIHQDRLKSEILDKIGAEDIIITASPEVLIDGIKDKLHTKKIVCSKLDVNTGNLSFVCMGENKVKAFKKIFPNTSIDEFYTDSMSDKPLIDIADNAFLVRGKNITQIKKKEQKLK